MSGEKQTVFGHITHATTFLSWKQLDEFLVDRRIGISCAAIKRDVAW